MTPRPPRAHKESYDKVAQLIALGLTQKEVGRRTNYSPRQVREILKSPMVQVLVQERRKHLNRPLEEKIAAHILGRQEHVLETVGYLMDHGASERVRLDAALAMWAMGREVLKVTGDGEEVTRIVFEHADIGEMERLMDEARGMIDVTPITDDQRESG